MNELLHAGLLTSSARQAQPNSPDEHCQTAQVTFYQSVERTGLPGFPRTMAEQCRRCTRGSGSSFSDFLEVSPGVTVNVKGSPGTVEQHSSNVRSPAQEPFHAYALLDC